MTSRVVPGMGLTMAAGLRAITFSRLLLPAFGGPTITTLCQHPQREITIATHEADTTTLRYSQGQVGDGSLPNAVANNFAAAVVVHVVFNRGN